MFKKLQSIIVVVVLASLGFYVYANYLTACSSTLSYDIGTVDPRFGITEERFAELAQGTEGIWEGPLEREFFRYDPEAKFKINLVFDDRQQRTIDEKNSRTEITTQSQIYKAKVQAYDAALNDYTQKNAEYEADVAAYEARLKKYNEDVDYWNANGGAPAKDYNRLQQEKTALQRESRNLESERQRLNTLVSTLNAQAQEINISAKDLNYDVDAYNGKFGSSREFDQGTYTGSAINIYQFNTEEDLRLVVAHEFGHALHINDHVDDPNAVMYYLMDKQNIKDLALTQADISAVRSSCNIR